MILYYLDRRYVGRQRPEIDAIKIRKNHFLIRDTGVWQIEDIKIFPFR
jgi:hypothetical protein